MGASQTVVMTNNDNKNVDSTTMITNNNNPNYKNNINNPNQEMMKSMEQSIDLQSNNERTNNTTTTATTINTRAKMHHPTLTKELIVKVIETGFVGAIDELTEQHTLSDVRQRILEEFDDEYLPESTSSSTTSSTTSTSSTLPTSTTSNSFSNSSSSFVFQRSDGVMISQKQERKKRAWDYVEKNINIVSFVSTSSSSSSSLNHHCPRKKQRTALALCTNNSNSINNQQNATNNITNTTTTTTIDHPDSNRNTHHHHHNNSSSKNKRMLSSSCTIITPRNPSTKEGGLIGNDSDSSTKENQQDISSSSSLLSLSQIESKGNNNLLNEGKQQGETDSSWIEGFHTPDWKDNNNNCNKDTKVIQMENDIIIDEEREQGEKKGDYDQSMELVEDGDGVIPTTTATTTNTTILPDTYCDHPTAKTDSGRHYETHPGEETKLEPQSCTEESIIINIAPATTATTTTTTLQQTSPNKQQDFSKDDNLVGPNHHHHHFHHPSENNDDNRIIPQQNRMKKDHDDSNIDKVTADDSESEPLTMKIHDINQLSHNSKDPKNDDDSKVETEIDQEPNITTLRKENAITHPDSCLLENNNNWMMMEETTETTVKEGNMTHQIQKDAMTQSCAVLQQLQKIVQTPWFCSEQRRNEILNEIKETLQKTAPNIVIGVLGNTGVGKSSLLNALLEEASILPTSGSRGCTAAVVELRFNNNLLISTKNSTSAPQQPVYQGEVEFITRQEWGNELKTLVDECSTNDKHIYAGPPDCQRQPEAAAAWQKIDQVYGCKTMHQYRGKSTDYVFQRLFNDGRIKRLLTPVEGSNKVYNSIQLQEGYADAQQAKELLSAYSQMSQRLRRAKKTWAKAFRSKINDYVYRKGNGTEPQTWPLIRKVVLQGPFRVLSTGACLVDLPGVRDANAARAKVSEQYLQNCNKIWVVAPIKRAVDDGTAKELLGEQFKRRLLMDGQYGSVSFICTQTDDCEATEIMRDHQDVAETEVGRWERMTHLQATINEIEKNLNDLAQEEEDLLALVSDAKQSLYDAKEELQDSLENDIDTQDGNEHDKKTINVNALEILQSMVNKRSGELDEYNRHLQEWKSKHESKMSYLRKKSSALQRKLKRICAAVRNEYSKACLQEDFRNGLKELCCNDDDDKHNNVDSENVPLPEDFEMSVYCISANDYLKIEGIKPNSDGPPSCFDTADETQIPALRSFVHQTTSDYRQTYSISFVEQANDLLERMKLIAAGSNNVPSGRSSRRFMSIFHGEISKLEIAVKQIADEFQFKSNAQVQNALYPSLMNGARKGQEAAISTVQSWGSTNRRTRHERQPNMNGLWHATYAATMRRNGEYVSKSCGAINLNEELCAPMEREFSSNWQQTMDSTIAVLLNQCEVKILSVCSILDRILATEFSKAGVDPRRLQAMTSTASRTCSNAIKEAFRGIKSFACASQRDLNRSLLPSVQRKMCQGYSSALEVPGGTGTFNRMKHVLENHTKSALSAMFSDSSAELKTSIVNLIAKLQSRVFAIHEVIRKSNESVYSVMWDDQRNTDNSSLVNPANQHKVQEVRDNLLPRLNELRKLQDNAMDLLNIKRDEMELDLVAVDTLEQTIDKKIEAAKESGDFIDLCDSDAELDIEPKPNSNMSRICSMKVKMEALSEALPVGEI